MNATHRLRASLWTLLAFATTGCATFQVIEGKSPSERAPAATDGLVVVSVTNNTGEVTQFDSIDLTRDEDAGAAKSNRFISYQLKQISRGMTRDTALFFGALPSGEYRFTKFSDDDSQKYLTLSPGGVLLLGSFKVEAGKISDLGRLVASSRNFSMLVGRSASMSNNADLLKRFVPAAAQFYTGEITSGWTASRHAQDRVEEFAASHPVGGSGMALLPGGDIAVATRMGTILTRNANGRWRALRSGRLESLLCVDPVDDESIHLVAGGELNTLLRLDSIGKFTSVDVGSLPPGNIIFVTGNPHAGWFIGHQQGNVVTVRKSASLEGGQWDVVRTERLDYSFWTGAQEIWFWRTIKGFAYATSKSGLHYYEHASSQWSDRAVPGNATLGVVEPSPGDAVGILTRPGGMGGVFATAYLSHDEAKTWNKVEPQLKIKMAAPRISPKGTLLFFSHEFGWSSNTPRLQASTDGGKTWTLQSELRAGSTIWVMPDGLLLVITGGSDGVTTIESSTDDGKTWKLEYTSFDRTL